MDIFKLVGSVFVDTSAANDSLAKTDEQAEKTNSKFSKVIQTAGKVAIGIGAAATAAGIAMYKVATDSAEASDKIDKMSQKIGVSREAYQELDFVLSQNGMDINQLQGGMKGLLAQMDKVTEGNKDATARFEELGVSVQNADGTMRSQEEVLFDTISAFQGMDDSAEKARLAQELFGKSGSELMPLLNSEAGSIEEMREQAHELGLVLGDDVIDAGVEFKDTMDQMKRSVSAVMTTIGAKVMPVFTTMANWVLAHMPQIQAVFEKVFGVLSVVVDGAIKVIQSILEWFGRVVSHCKDIFGPTIEMIKEAWDNLKVALSPIIDVVQKLIEKFKGAVGPMDSAKTTANILNGVLKVVGATINVVAGIVNTFVAAIRGIKTTIDTVITAVSNFGTKVKSVFDTVKNTVTSVVSSIKNAFNFSWSLPHIKLPHFSVSPRGWKFGDLLKGTIPSLGIQWYGKGYDEAQVLDKPTIFGANNGQLVAGGERNGNEIVSGEKHLLDLMDKTVNKVLDDKLGNALEAITELLTEHLPNCANTQLVLDSGALIGSTAPAFNRELGNISRKTNRGVSTW